jgi:hypothetical protein
LSHATRRISANFAFGGTAALPLPSSEGLVGILGAIVQPAAGFAPVDRAQSLERGAVGCKLIGYNDVGPALLLQ